MTNPWGKETIFFHGLTPDVIDHSLTSLGFQPTGRVIPLNSLENRVYEIEVRNVKHEFEGPCSTESVVVKYYRPGRWNEVTLKEEHRFLNELYNYEIPVVPPLDINGKTLFYLPEIETYYTIYPKLRGRLKDELNKNELQTLGRLIARLHNVGRLGKFEQRFTFSAENIILPALTEIESSLIVPIEIRSHIITVARQLLQFCKTSLDYLPTSRIHGDFHRGNVLWNDSTPWIMDLDDSMTGPVEQDLWPILPGRDEESLRDRETFLEAYHQMSSVPVSINFRQVEALRSVRLIHFSGWIHKRWSDQAFPRVFTHFAEPRYWEQFLLELKEQIGLLID